MSVMRVRFMKLGGHYYCRVFTARERNMTYAENGELIFDEKEWPEVQTMMKNAEFLGEEKDNYEM